MSKFGVSEQNMLEKKLRENNLLLEGESFLAGKIDKVAERFFELPKAPVRNLFILAFNVYGFLNDSDPTKEELEAAFEKLKKALE